MTTIEKFVQFMHSLPAESAQSVEETLDQIMASYSEEVEYTPEQLTELDQRMAEAEPEYSSKEAIAAIFGKPFSA